MHNCDDPDYPVSPSRTLLAETLRFEVGRRAAEFKGSVFNTAITAGTNIFAQDLEPTYTPCIFRIYACFDASGVLTVRRTRAGVTVGEQLNSGSPLAANAAYIFDVPVDADETINLQYSVDATVLKLSVMEIGGMV